METSKQSPRQGCCHCALYECAKYAPTRVREDRKLVLLSVLGNAALCNEIVSIPSSKDLKAYIKERLLMSFSFPVFQRRSGTVTACRN